jgi:hypothetical protein
LHTSAELLRLLSTGVEIQLAQQAIELVVKFRPLELPSGQIDLDKGSVVALLRPPTLAPGTSRFFFSPGIHETQVYE